MALRSTYDTGLYGSGFYGIQETTQGSASASVALSASAAAVTVVSASASASITTTVSNPTFDIIKDGSATVSLSGIVSVSAVTYEVVPGFRSGYGVNTYGTFMYGENRSIEEASATVSITVTPSVVAQVTRNVSASASITTSASCFAVYSVVGSATVNVSISPDVAYNRIKSFSASEQATFSVDLSTRYKWLDADDPTTTWTDASDPTTTWTDADYLERAA